MRCLPYKAIKKNTRYDGIYSWFRQDSKLVHSFNNQPAAKDEDGSLSWAEEGYYFRKYNKPTLILMSVKGLHFVDSNLNRYMPLTDKDVHPDYRKQWREWHQGLAK